MTEPTARQRAYRIIFEHNTPAGKTFDVALIISIVASVMVVMLESVATNHPEWFPKTPRKQTRPCSYSLPQRHKLAVKPPKVCGSVYSVI